MRTFRTSFFLFISLLTVAGCRAPSIPWQAGNFDRTCFKKFVPVFQAQWYKASIDVQNKHLSGLLLFKSVSDSVVRVVFTNEGGATFFDFEFGPKQAKVNYALDQINKGPVILTLQNDLQLVLMRYEKDPHAELLTDSQNIALKVVKDKKTIYLVATQDCQQLRRIEQEWGGKRKVEVMMRNYADGVPDSVSIVHHNFKMQINLKKLQR